MSTTVTKSQTQAHAFRPQEIHLICAAQAHEHVENVTTAIVELAKGLGYDVPFILHYRRPKPRTIDANVLILTDHPIRLANTPQDLMALVTGFLKQSIEIQIPGHFHIKPNSEVATAFLALDGARKAMRSARIREGLHLARQRGVHVGRKRISPSQHSELKAAVTSNGSYRSAARALSDQGIEISKSTLHAIMGGRR